MVINPDGSFTVDVTDTPAGTTQFDKVEVDITVPKGKLAVTDLKFKACVHPGKIMLLHFSIDLE